MASSTHDRMLETTGRLLQTRGFHGTSLSQILAESDAPRGSLYHHFPGGKEQLVLEATRRGVARVTEELEEALATADDTAAGVRIYVEAAAAELRETDYLFGCPVAPIILDAPGDAPPLAEICRAAVGDWSRILREALTAEGVKAERAASLATLIICALEGGLLLARAARDTAPLDRVAEELEVMVRSATAG